MVSLKKYSSVSFLSTITLVLFTALFLLFVIGLWNKFSVKENYNSGTNPNLWFKPSDSTFCYSVGAGPSKPYGSPNLPLPAEPVASFSPIDPIDWQKPMPSWIWSQTGGGTFCRPYGSYDKEAGVTNSTQTQT